MRLVIDDFLDRQRDRFVLFLPVFLAGGMLAYFALSAEPSVVWSAAAWLAAGALAVAAWRWPIARGAALCLAFATTGFALACLATWRAPPWPALPRHAAVISGRIAEMDILPEGRRVVIAAPSLDGAPPLARALRIRLRASDATSLAPGDTVRVRALVKPPAPPDYPGGWDTQREAFFAALGGYGFAIGPATRLTGAGGGACSALRAGIARRIMVALPGGTGAVAATLLTGLGSAIPPAQRAAFQDSGLAHLLAVAGLHIGIVMGLVFGATRFAFALWERAALRWPTRQIAALAALAAGGAYLALTGAHVPIIRSFAMAALVTLGVLTGRRAISLRGLALAATVLLVLAPSSVVGVSFQMSFAAVLTLIAGYEMARPHLARLGAGTRWRTPALYVGGLMLTSLLAGTASLPFAAYHFGKATLFYVPSNMVAVPLTALWVMPWGLAALALMPLGLERLALVPMGWGIGGLQAIADGVAGWPDAVVAVPQMPGWALALVALGMVWAGLWRGWLRMGGMVPLAAGLVAVFLVRPPDVLVTPGAGLIAIRAGGRILVEAGRRATPFERAAPGRVWGGGAGEALGGQPGVACSDAGCRVDVRGGSVVVARTADGAECTAALIVSLLRVGSCANARVVDRAAARDGGMEIWLTHDGSVVSADRATRGVRPWVIATQERLPMAQTE